MNLVYLIYGPVHTMNFDYLSIHPYLNCRAAIYKYNPLNDSVESHDSEKKLDINEQITIDKLTINQFLHKKKN